MDATRIIAIRHGETAWNVDTRIQGQLDIGLNETGRRQAHRVARALTGEPISAIYSSDLLRARDTARSIADATGQPLELHEGLRERGFGVFQGKTYAEIETTGPTSRCAGASGTRCGRRRAVNRCWLCVSASPEPRLS
jgi:probable phosphoglycerate mutase